MADRGRLLRILGVGFGLAVGIGNTIASGIVRAPGDIAAVIHDRWLFLSMWIAGGLYALLGANCLAELGAAVPRSGGQYVFCRRALGEYPGFIVGFGDWLSTCGATATVAIVVAEYLEALVPALAGRTAAAGILLILAFALLQWRGLRWGAATQNFTSLLKALALMALVGVCFFPWSGPSAGVIAGRQPAEIGGLLPAILVALQAVIYTYDGWSAPIYFSEETRETGRSIPRALFLGVLSVLAIYLLVNLALLHVLPLERIAGDKFALGAAVGSVVGPVGDRLARGVMIISMLAGLNAYHLMATRVLNAMSRDGLFWSAAASVNPGGTPAAALWTSVAASVLMVLFGGTFKALISALSFFFVANYALSFLSLLVLRRREPALSRPFRAWGHPLTTALALIASLAFLGGAIVQDLSSGERSSVYALGLLAASYPAFRLLEAARRPAG